MTRHVDAMVAGGGRAGLAAGHHLRRKGLDFTVLEAEPAPRGAWPHSALDEGRGDTGGDAPLGDVTAVPPVRAAGFLRSPPMFRAARAAGLLRTRPMFRRLTATGVQSSDGSRSDADAMIWCTGFRPAPR